LGAGINRRHSILDLGFWISDFVLKGGAVRLRILVGGGLKLLWAGINRRPYNCVSAQSGGDKPPPLHTNLSLKVAAGFIPAQRHNN
jgi:hypothetical protein